MATSPVSALPLIRFTTERAARRNHRSAQRQWLPGLQSGIVSRSRKAALKQTDEIQLAFKRSADPEKACSIRQR